MRGRQIAALGRLVLLGGLGRLLVASGLVDDPASYLAEIGLPLLLAGFGGHGLIMRHCGVQDNGRK